MNYPDYLTEKQKSYLDQTKKEYIEIQYTTKEEIKLSDSKVGGIPYLPSGYDIPKDVNGAEMIFLSQINWKQVPKLDSYPETGMTYFFIADEDVNGVNFDDCTKSDVKVIHVENIEETEELDETGYIGAVEWKPYTTTIKLLFQKKEMVISTVSWQFNQVFSEWEKNLGEDNIYDFYDLFAGEGSRIGGYPYFTQNDAREYTKGYEHAEILLQLDSKMSIDGNQKYEILWGDVGVANFFIRKEDLLAKNFEQIMFTWDCG